MKDSASFAIETREFVWNMPTWDLREAMNTTSASLARGENEFDHAGLEMAPSRLVAPPRVAATPCAFECKVTNTVNLRDIGGHETDRHLVVGQVVGVHLDERFIDDDGSSTSPPCARSRAAATRPTTASWTASSRWSARGSPCLHDAVDEVPDEDGADGEHQRVHAAPAE
jgi:flavin reductase (DIM6/NTAB) family NADH-FMN oxidoreductase RutF